MLGLLTLFIHSTYVYYICICNPISDDDDCDRDDASHKKCAKNYSSGGGFCWGASSLFFACGFLLPSFLFRRARHFAARSLINLAKDLDEDVVFVDGSANNANNEREEEEEEEEEPETYERPSSPMPPMDPSAPPPPVAPSMPPPDDAIEKRTGGRRQRRRRLRRRT